MYIYMYHIYIHTFIPGRWAPSLTIACPLWSPVRDLWSPQDLWRGDTKIRGLIREVLLGRGSIGHALLETCERSPCTSKFSGNPRRSFFGVWALPERKVFWGVRSVARSGPGELLLAVNYQGCLRFSVLTRCGFLKSKILRSVSVRF